MSKNKVTEDGFRIVRTKRRGKSKSNLTASPFVTGGSFTDCEIDKDTALRRIKAAKEDLEVSDYYKSFLITLKESIDVLKQAETVEIVCLGLGHIGECMISRYQLALVLCLREHFNVKCLVHDPIFFSGECELLKELDFNLIEENEEGKHALQKNGLTIVYLPHCPKQLTNNLLWHNWGKTLANCILICNSFLSLIETQAQSVLNDNVPYILNIYAYVQEFSLVNSFKFNDIFNDTAIHIFPPANLEQITDNFWVKSDKQPEYKDGHEFITSDIVKNLHTKTNKE